MPTIEILGWKENFAGFTGWDEHAKSELRTRLRRGLKASPAEIRRLARRINAREPVSLPNVHDEGVYGLTQILETSGAYFRVSAPRIRGRSAFRNVPKWSKRLLTASDSATGSCLHFGRMTTQLFS